MVGHWDDAPTESSPFADVLKVRMADLALQHPVHRRSIVYHPRSVKVLLPGVGVMARPEQLDCRGGEPR